MSEVEKKFRELGYLKGQMNNYIEWYNKYPNGEMASISFESTTKTIMASLYYDNNKIQKSRALAMTTEELQATYLYAKELGWYD